MVASAKHEIYSLTKGATTVQDIIQRHMPEEGTGTGTAEGWQGFKLSGACTDSDGAHSDAACAASPAMFTPPIKIL